MEIEKLIETKICSSLSFNDKTDEISFEFIENEIVKNQLNDLLQNFKQAQEKEEEKTKYCGLMIELMKDHLNSHQLTTVGQILDFFEVVLKLMFSDNINLSSVVLTEEALFNNFFNMLPENWETDPVKVHLLTKLINETLNDFNNNFYIMSKLLIQGTRFALYVALTIFWVLYKNFFKNSEIPQPAIQNYYKMYKVEKFFKLLPSYEQFSNLETDMQYKFLSLISIYANYNLLNDESDEHQVFSDFFTRNQNNVERLRTWVQQLKSDFERSHPVGGRIEQHVDVLTLIELMEYNLLAELDDKCGLLKM